MNRHNYFVKILKKVNISISSILEKYLNKLNFKSKKNDISKFFRSLKAFLALLTLIILGLVYLSMPHFFDKNELEAQLKNQLSQKSDFNFKFSENFKYSFFPTPSFTFENVSIIENDKKLANIKHLKMYLSVKNLYSLNSIKVKNILLKNSNFDFYNQDFNFFIKILKNDFSKFEIKIIDSNIFFKNPDEEVLFINKIKKMKYYYNKKNFKNTLYAENEIFNFPYSLELYDDETNKIVFSKLNLNILKLQIENELDYNNHVKYGSVRSIYNKNKHEMDYEFDETYLRFNIIDKASDPKFNYNGKFSFKPFYASISGTLDKLNISNLISSNSVLTQFLKTEILNNENLNIDATLDSKKIFPHHNLIDLIINFKIKEGLIDLDNTMFNWLDHANFKISETLLYVNENNLLLDGKLIINVKNHNEIYKFLQTPRNYRTAIEKIKFNFVYNFDQQTMNLSDIEVNNEINQEIGQILKELTYQNSNLQNKIYLKSLISTAIKAYAG